MSSQQLKGKPAFVKERVQLEREFFRQGVSQDMIRLLDRVEQLLGQAYEVGYNAAGSNSEAWSNSSAVGYTILAAKRLGYSDDQATQLARAINRQFDVTTIGEAKRAYIDFLH